MREVHGALVVGQSHPHLVQVRAMTIIIDCDNPRLINDQGDRDSVSDTGNRAFL